MFRRAAASSITARLAVSLVLVTSFGACKRKVPGTSPRGLAIARGLRAPGSLASSDNPMVTSTAAILVIGDLGLDPGTVDTRSTHAEVLGGSVHPPAPASLEAREDATAAYEAAAEQPCDVDLTGQDLGARTLVPGVYCFENAARLTGTLVLDAGGDPDAAFIFQVGGTLTTAPDSAVTLVGGSASNVYWQVASAVTLGGRTTFSGNILALTSITLETGASTDGQAL